MVGGAGMSSNSGRTRPANGSGRRGSMPCRRRLSAGRKLDASLLKSVIVSLPPGCGGQHAAGTTEIAGLREPDDEDTGTGRPLAERDGP